MESIHDTKEIGRINSEIAKVENSTYSNPELERKIEAMKNAKFDASAFESKITELEKELTEAQASLNITDDEKKKIVSATLDELHKSKDISGKYKAMVNFTAQKDREQRAKEFSESPEGIAYSKAIADKIDSLNKEGKFGGPSGSDNPKPKS